MFCDLVGSTALSERLDPEELRELIGGFQNACGAVISEFGGYIARYMGDGLLVYFGYPKAHEDDAERAVRAGLGIIKAVSTLAGEGDELLHVRVGISTGLVVAGDIIGEGAAEERAVLGDTPNLAARLQGIAAPDTVVIPESTWRLVEGLFNCDDLGPQTLKGISEPVPVYRVRSESDAASRFEALARRGLTALVGRDEEISILWKRWNQAGDGEGQIVLLCGEAGLGKSRILRGFRDRVQADSHERVLCYCSPYHQNSAFHPIIDRLERSLCLDAKAAPESNLDKLDNGLRELGLSVDELAPVFAGLLALPTNGRYPKVELSADALKQKTIDAVATMLESLARRAPLVMVIEDAHWIDPSTLEFLNHWCERLRTSAVLLLITFRPGFEQTWGSLPHMTSFTLNRLGRRECAQIVAKVARGRNLPASVLDEILDKADGVPLFVEELTKTVLESGLLREEAGRFVLEGPLALLAIPASLHDSLMARLDRVATVKEVAQLGATLGRTFDFNLIVAVWPHDEDRLVDGLMKLVEAELLFQRGMLPNATYEFKHALVQDAAYQSMLKSTRQQFHTRVAETLEHGMHELGEIQPELLAHHLTEAGLSEKAVSYWRRAGERAVSRAANSEAVGHFSRGLEVVDTLKDDTDRAGLELGLRISLANALRVIERYDEAFAILDRAEEIARGQGLTLLLSRIHHLRGNLYFPLGRIEACQAEHEQSLECARIAKSPKAEARALSGLADAAYAAGRMITANGYFQRCVDLCRERDFEDIEAVNLAMRGFTRMTLSDLDGAEDDGAAAIRLSNTTGDLKAELIGETITYNVCLERADFGDGLEHVERARDLTRRLGTWRFEPQQLVTRSKILFLNDGDHSVVTALREVMPLSRETGIGFSGPRVLSAIALMTDDDAERSEVLREGEEILAAGAISQSHFWFYRDAMETCLATGDWDEVDRYAANLEAYTAAESLPYCDFFIARGRALAAVGRDARNDALNTELRRLLNWGRETGFTLTLPAIEAALSA